MKRSTDEDLPFITYFVAFEMKSARSLFILVKQFHATEAFLIEFLSTLCYHYLLVFSIFCGVSRVLLSISVISINGCFLSFEH